MSERGPDPGQPEGVPPEALGWYARMERQSPGSPTQPGSALPSAGPGRVPRTAPLDAAVPSAPVQRRRRVETRPGGRPRNRRRTPSWGVILSGLGTLLLAAALVAIVVTNPEIDGTSATGSQKAKAPAATSSAAPSLGESTETPTDTGSAATDTAAPTTAAPTASGTGEDPLGIGVPMTSPACDGTWVVILGSATDPATYADDVTALLSADPEAKYVLTEGSCGSLRQSTADGNQIYAAYLGPYPDQASACAVSTETGGGVYVKRMDDTTPAEQTWECRGGGA